MPVVSSTNKTWLVDIRHAARKWAAATCLSIDNREDDNNLTTWCATGGTGIAQQIDAQEQSPRHSTGFRPTCGYQYSHTRRPTGFATQSFGYQWGPQGVHEPFVLFFSLIDARNS
jgi:hypothetical protein